MPTRANRAAAMSRPATGQFTPGALSSANVQTTHTTSAPSAPRGSITNPIPASAPPVNVNPTGSTDKRIQTPGQPTTPVPTTQDFQTEFTNKMATAQAALAAVNNHVMTNNPQAVAGHPDTNTPFVNTQNPWANSPPIQNTTPPLEKPWYQQVGQKISDVVNTALFQPLSRNTAALITAPVVGGFGMLSGSTSSTEPWLVNVVEDSAKPGILPKAAAVSAETSGLLKTLFSKNVIKGGVVAGGVLATMTWIAEKTIGGQNFGKFLGNEEASQAAGIVVGIAAHSGTYQDYLDARKIQNDTLNVDVGTIPYKNVAEGLQAYKDASQKAGALMDKIMADQEQARLTNTTPADVAAQRKAAEQKASVDYYNSERIRVEKQLEDMKAAADATQNQGRIDTENAILKARSESSSAYLNQKAAIDRQTAAFLEQQRLDLIKAQEEEQLKISQYWLDYAKMKAKLAAQQSANSGGSHLGFGLLR